MSDLTDDDVDKILADTRYFAFVDVLGYRAILFGSQFASDKQRVHRLYEVWECLYTAIDAGCAPFQPNVEPVLFSDSLFVSSIDPLALGGCLANVYANVCTYYAAHPKDWMPWLRAGLGHGWGIDVHDPTLKGAMKDYIEAYRNPAGPGPAEAYLVAEKSKRKGARVLVPEFVKTQVFGSARGADRRDLALRGAADGLCKQPWTSDGSFVLPSGQTELFDLPWWRMLGGGAKEAVHAFEQHAWQAQDAEANAHLDATLALLRSA